MSRQQYGARKAIAGMMAAEKRTEELCTETVRRFDACQTVKELREVLAWGKEHSFFLRSSESDQQMRAAFDRARERCNPKLAPQLEGN